MTETNIILPSKPRIVKEDERSGTYEIDGLYPGYGYTLGNSLRRIILSSVPGAAITSVKIDGVSHEYSTLDGVKEDVVNILLNLKRVRIKMASDEPVSLSLKVKGEGEIKASDIKTPGQAEILNPDQKIATLTSKTASLDIEMIAEVGLGYVPKETLQEDRVEIGTIALDANFSPVRRVNYEVENMRVGDRTDFNRLRVFIETDGTSTAKEVLEKSIEIMIHQLKAIIGFKEEEEIDVEEELKGTEAEKTEDSFNEEEEKEHMKTRIDSLGLSSRTENALSKANIRTVGGLARKNEGDLLELPGLGEKGLQEIKRALGNFGIILKS